jgi:hypothetical protein
MLLNGRFEAGAGFHASEENGSKGSDLPAGTSDPHGHDAADRSLPIADIRPPAANVTSSIKGRVDIN